MPIFIDIVNVDPNTSRCDPVFACRTDPEPSIS